MHAHGDVCGTDRPDMEIVNVFDIDTSHFIDPLAKLVYVKSTRCSFHEHMEALLDAVDANGEVVDAYEVGTDGISHPEVRSKVDQGGDDDQREIQHDISQRVQGASIHARATFLIP